MPGWLRSSRLPLRMACSGTCRAHQQWRTRKMANTCSRSVLQAGTLSVLQAGAPRRRLHYVRLLLALASMAAAASAAWRVRCAWLATAWPWQATLCLHAAFPGKCLPPR
jgi:hypothetical protein